MESGFSLECYRQQWWYACVASSFIFFRCTQLSVVLLYNLYNITGHKVGPSYVEKVTDLNKLTMGSGDTGWHWIATMGYETLSDFGRGYLLCLWRSIWVKWLCRSRQPEVNACDGCEWYCGYQTMSALCNFVHTSFKMIIKWIILSIAVWMKKGSVFVQDCIFSCPNASVIVWVWQGCSSAWHRND